MRSANVVWTLIFLIIAAIAALTIGIVSRDIDPPDVSGLMLERKVLLVESNAYTCFIAATNVFFEPGERHIVSDYLDGEPVDAAQVRNIITRNAKCFDLIDEGVARGICITPEFAGYDDPNDPLIVWRAIARAMALKARYARLAGDYAEATDSCISLLRFGDIVQHDAENCIHYLIGAAALDLGLRESMALGRTLDVPSKDLRRLSDVLADLGPFDRGLIRAVKTEFAMAMNTVDDFSNGALGGKRRRMAKYIFQVNKTKATIAGFFHNVVSNAPLVYAEMDLLDEKDIPGFGDSRFKQMAKPNALGKTLYTMFFPFVGGLVERRCKLDCVVAAARITLACTLYEQENKKRPQRLDQLIPVYLSAIPIDPYDGEPLRFNAEAYAVYSVGIDLKDSGGSVVVPAKDKHVSDVWKLWNAEDVVFLLKETQGTDP